MKLIIATLSSLISVSLAETFVCPQGQYLAQIKGKRSQHINAIAVTCSDGSSSKAWGDTKSGINFILTAPAGGFKELETSSDASYLDSIKLGTVVVGVHGGATTIQKDSNGCPANGLTVTAGQYVSSLVFSFVCPATSGQPSSLPSASVPTGNRTQPKLKNLELPAKDSQPSAATVNIPQAPAPGSSQAAQPQSQLSLAQSLPNPSTPQQSQLQNHSAYSPQPLEGRQKTDLSHAIKQSQTQPAPVSESSVKQLKEYSPQPLEGRQKTALTDAIKQSQSQPAPVSESSVKQLKEQEKQTALSDAIKQSQTQPAPVSESSVKRLKEQEQQTGLSDAIKQSQTQAALVSSQELPPSEATAKQEQTQLGSSQPSSASSKTQKQTEGSEMQSAPVFDAVPKKSEAQDQPNTLVNSPQQNLFESDGSPQPKQGQVTPLNCPDKRRIKLIKDTAGNVVNNGEVKCFNENDGLQFSIRADSPYPEAQTNMGTVMLFSTK